MSRPKIPADGFVVVNGVGGFSLIVQQAEFDVSQAGNGPTAIPLTPIEEIRISAVVAKQLLRALAANIGQYEEGFGEIREIPDFGGKSN